MQFIGQENSFLPAFSVWSIEKLINVLLNNVAKRADLQFVKKQFGLISFFLLLKTKLFEFKFYR
ncbi:hypothetical protein BWZ22_10165 [Seonamhaeicola sp. S2-3]|nr:hypothetical protein BWZ22_10165 [Seonamhaeicola sp. S2-3]